MVAFDVHKWHQTNVFEMNIQNTAWHVVPLQVIRSLEGVGAQYKYVVGSQTLNYKSKLIVK